MGKVLQKKRDTVRLLVEGSWPKSSLPLPDEPLANYRYLSRGLCWVSAIPGTLGVPEGW